jgi:NAD-dependent DNA ligase
LIANYEANVHVNEKTVVRALLDYFDEHFLGGYARRIDDLWFSNYLRWWKERKKAEKKLQKIREKVRKLPAKRVLPKSLPKRINDEVFAFTGKIEDWPREPRLYPTVRKLGGRIATAAKSIKSAACLVHGEILQGKKTTKKLRGARDYGIPIISEDEFFQILSYEKRLRGKG